MKLEMFQKRKVLSPGCFTPEKRRCEVLGSAESGTWSSVDRVVLILNCLYIYIYREREIPTNVQIYMYMLFTDVRIYTSINSGYVSIYIYITLYPYVLSTVISPIISSDTKKIGAGLQVNGRRQRRKPWAHTGDYKISVVGTPGCHKLSIWGWLESHT
jgi:hypothetical protein